MLGSSIFLGMMIGSLIGGTVADSIGRSAVFRILFGWITIFGVASAAAPSFPALVALRGLVGLGIGGVIPAANTIYVEFCPSAMRGMHAILLNLFHKQFSLLPFMQFLKSASSLCPFFFDEQW